MEPEASDTFDIGLPVLLCFLEALVDCLQGADNLVVVEA